ncbi:MAG: hypothetical protein ABIP35_06060, partial [Ginsengibacter sp.]
MEKRIFLFIVAFGLMMLHAFASDSIYIIPQPVKVVAHEGSFILPGNVTISVNTGVQEVVEM